MTIIDSVRLVLDLSTAHITESDSRLLSVEAAFNDVPSLRVVPFEYGFYLTIISDLKEFLADDKSALREAGLSDAFIKILEKAAAHEINFIILDRDGGCDDELEVFEW